MMVSFTERIPKVINYVWYVQFCKAIHVYFSFAEGDILFHVHAYCVWAAHCKNWTPGEMVVLEICGIVTITLHFSDISNDVHYLPQISLLIFYSVAQGCSKATMC